MYVRVSGLSGDSMRLTTTITLSAALLVPSLSHAETVTFDYLTGNQGDPYFTYSESGFTVSKIAADVFVGRSYGAPAPSLFWGSFYGTPDLYMEVNAGGRLFSFDSWNMSANNGSIDYTVTGFLNGAKRFQLIGVQSSGFFEQRKSGTNFKFDRVVFGLTANGTSGNFDNFRGQIVPVPETSTWVDMLLGFGLLGASIRRVGRYARQA